MFSIVKDALYVLDSRNIKGLESSVGSAQSILTSYRKRFFETDILGVHSPSVDDFEQLYRVCREAQKSIAKATTYI